MFSETLKTLYALWISVKKINLFFYYFAQLASVPCGAVPPSAMVIGFTS
jgi:hypothetical protein